MIHRRYYVSWDDMQNFKYYIPEFFPHSGKCQAKKRQKIFAQIFAPKVNVSLDKVTAVGLKNLKYINNKYKLGRRTEFDRIKAYIF